MTEPIDVTTTRTAYDTVAADYADLLRDELATKPMDRAVLAAFAEYVLAAGAGLVADIGCGPGRVTAHLAALGLDTVGIDLSPGMVAVARAEHPALRFNVGSMDALDLADESLGGLLAWYSIIHTPPERLPEVFREFHRVLAPGGYLQLAFQSGEGARHISHAYGHDIALDAHLLTSERIAPLLTEAGFVIQAELLRAPDQWERTPQAFVSARRG